MSSPGLLLLLLLLAPPPLQPSLLPPLETPEGKAAVTGLILSALERATSFLEKRLPEINLDGVVGFRVLEGGCALIALDWPLGNQFSTRLPALHHQDLPTSGSQIVCFDIKEERQEFLLWLSRLRTQVVSLRMQVGFLASLSGLRI